MSSNHPTAAGNLLMLQKRNNTDRSKQRSVNFKITTNHFAPPKLGLAQTTTSSFHRLGLNSKLAGNHSFVDGGSHETVFKVSSNVNISELLRSKEPPTKNYLSETTARRLKRFDSSTRAQTITPSEQTGFGATRYQESGERRSKTGLGNYQSQIAQTLNTTAGGALFKISKTILHTYPSDSQCE